MEQKIIDFIAASVSPVTAKQYSDFCDWIHNEIEYNQLVTSSVFANLNFKKKLAKRIVRSVLYDDSDSFVYLLLNDLLDVRLRSLIKYYLAVEIHGNANLKEAVIRKACHCLNTHWIEGKGIVDTSGEAVVRMRNGDPLYQGYRFFAVNMLCFTVDKFVLGFRTDSGPIRSPMKYYKGCKPLGKKTSDDGIEWNAILFDRSLSDDHIAIFSNQLDGEGTIEMCDWLSNHKQRAIFRCDY